MEFPSSSFFFDEAAAGLIPSSHHQQEYDPYSLNPCIEDFLPPPSPPSPPPSLLTPAASPGALFLDDLFADIDTPPIDPKDLMEFLQDLQLIPPTLPLSPPHSTPSTSSRLSSTPTLPASPPPATPKPRPRQRKPRKDITYGCMSPTCALPSHTPPIPSANHHHHIADDPMHKKRLCCRFLECNVCPGFVTRKDRDRHEVSKHKLGQRFSCSVCGLEMARLDNMRVHVRGHPGQTEEGVSSKIRRKGGR